MPRQPTAFNARQMFAQRVDLANVSARTQQRARDGLFVVKGYARSRRDPVGRGATRYQHQYQIVGGRSISERQRSFGRLQAGRVRDRMAGFDHAYDARRPAIAVAGHR